MAKTKSPKADAKKAAKAERKAALAAETAVIAERRNALARAYELDAAAALAPFARWVAKAKTAGEPDLAVQLEWVSSLNGETPEKLALREWMESLLETNMADVYGPDDWPAVQKTKRRELREDNARFLFVYPAPDKENAPAQGSAKQQLPIAFVQYRFDEEAEALVVYCYELQLAPEARRRGLGKFLMCALELLGKKAGMGGVMLTVQRSNTSARAFYAACKYDDSCISPSKVDPWSDEEEYSYDILDKMWSPEAQAALQKHADEAKAEWAKEELQAHDAKQAHEYTASGNT
mmetsp:Transcript_12230/g.40182  ORF Transcript_12230/g.40182 Transcript_12230/m.40182 type:complete len:292 (+) Transcript_12230:20-895(+)